MVIDFEWDEHKAAANLVKHRVSFEDSARVFQDPFARFEIDLVDRGEQRWRVVGLMDQSVLLVVVHVLREHDGSELIRIISARKAQPHERRRYEREDD